MKAKCSRCGMKLDEISFVEPVPKVGYPEMKPRPPLCEPCWQIVYKEMYG